MAKNIFAETQTNPAAVFQTICERLELLPDALREQMLLAVAAWLNLPIVHDPSVRKPEY